MMGLVSDDGVHSHNTHIYGLLQLAKRQGLEEVYVHCFLGGRDMPPASGKEYVEELEAKMDATTRWTEITAGIVWRERTRRS